MARERAYSDDKDLMKVPLDEEVLVLVPGETVETEDKVESKDIDDKKKIEVETDDETVKKLNEQVEALRAANTKANEEILAEQAKRQRVEQEAYRLAQGAISLKTEAEKSQHGQLKSALESAQNEQESHKKDYLAFLEAGDFVQAAEAQSKMSRAAARVVAAEGNLAQFETVKGEAEERTKIDAQLPPRQPQPVDVMTMIDGNPNLLPSEKTFMKSHPELMTDNQKNAELGVAYNRAVAKGLSRGTPEYFSFIEEFMGYKEASSSKKTDDDDDDTTARREAAPVRRDNSGGRHQSKPSQVKLTPEMREIARNMGISEIGYAKRFLELQDQKQTNPEKYNRTR